MAEMKVCTSLDSKQCHVDSMFVHTQEDESKVSPMSALPASLVTAATTTKDLVPLSDNACDSSSKLKVFMYWGQGWQSACPLAKICLESWKFVPSVEVVPLHEAQVSKLLEKELGPEKMRKFRNLSHQMKSDIVRLRVLYHMGGIWADASLFASGDVVEWLRSIKVLGQGTGSLDLTKVDTFFMYQRGYDPAWKGLPVKDVFTNALLGGMNLSSWFIVSSKHNRVLKKFLDRFEESVFSSQKNLPYFLIHATIQSVIRNDPDVNDFWYKKMPNVDSFQAHQLDFADSYTAIDAGGGKLKCCVGNPIHKLSMKVLTPDFLRALVCWPKFEQSNIGRLLFTRFEVTGIRELVAGNMDLVERERRARVETYANWRGADTWPGPRRALLANAANDLKSAGRKEWRSWQSHHDTEVAAHNLCRPGADKSTLDHIRTQLRSSLMKHHGVPTADQANALMGDAVALDAFLQRKFVEARSKINSAQIQCGK